MDCAFGLRTKLATNVDASGSEAILQIAAEIATKVDNALLARRQEAGFAAGT